MKHILQQQKNGYLYARFDESGALLETTWLETLDALKSVETEGEWYCLVSGQDVLTTTATVPGNTSKSRLLDLVPYALEDQLADPIESLHFALGEFVDAQHIVVSVIRKSILKKFLDDVSVFNIRPAAVMPDYLALPLFDDGASIAVYGSDVLVRLGAASGFSTHPDLLKTLLESEQQSLGDAFPTEWHWYLVSTLSRSPLVSWGALQHSVSTSLSFEESYEEIMNPAVNLLQGEFSLQSVSRTVRRRWLRASYWAIGIFVLTLLAQGGDWMYSQWHSRQQDQAISALYTQLFFGKSAPESISMTEIRRLLVQRKQDINRDWFLLTLDKLAPLINQESVTLTRMRFASHQDLELQFVVNTKSDANVVLENLETHAFHVKRQAISPSGAGKFLLMITVGADR